MIQPTIHKTAIWIAIMCSFALAVQAQTSGFNFAGKLPDSYTPGNGLFEMEMRLYDAATGGTQVGALISLTNVSVTDRTFAVDLDFGSAAFPGADRFVETSFRLSPSDPFTLITPRKRILSAPYSIRSASTSELGGMPASSYVQTTDPRLSDARPPTTGSNNYIRNSTTNQAGANFNIDGSGSAAIFNASTQYNLGGNRVLGGAFGSGNLFVGVGAGSSNTTGFNNTSVGTDAGQLSTTATRNSFFGAFAGQRTTSSSNSFFGGDAGTRNTTGGNNSFFGALVGWLNTTGSNNAFFGTSAGQENTTGHNNSFFGYRAGRFNTVGRYNSFFGHSAGDANTTGEYNVFVGLDAGVSNTTGSQNSFFGRGSGLSNTTGSNNTLLGRNTNVSSGGLSYATAVGAGAVATESNSVWLGRAADIVYVPGFLRLSQLGGAGATALCRNNANTIGTCSSSLRYKTNIGQFSPGLVLVNRLNPITFDWKDGGMHDLGLGAEDVAAIEPLLVTYNEKGQVEGVKYDRIGVVLINAVKEQQKMIERQQGEIVQLKALVCATNKNAEICKGM